MTAVATEIVQTVLTTLAAEQVPAEVVAALTQKFEQAEIQQSPDGVVIVSSGQRLVSVSPYGSLTLFLPDIKENDTPKRLATYDRQGRLLLLMDWSESGPLNRFKVRLPDGRFLGVFCRAASHLAWGESDSVVQLAGETGFTIDRPLTLFAATAYEALESLPPLDAPMNLPVGAGSTILNVFSLLARDQGRKVLRYRGPYPTERLFATLCESFRYSGEPGVMRERFARDAEQAAVQLRMEEPPVDWEPRPHERFFPAAHTCVQLRNGIEKVYDYGRVYYHPDLFPNAYALRVEQENEETVRYVAALTVLGQSIEDHLVLAPDGEIIERLPTPQGYFLKGNPQLSDEWKATLCRLIASESTSLLQSALWPAFAEVQIIWSDLRGVLWQQEGNDLLLHAGMIAAYRTGLSQVRSAGERLLLAARLTSEIARLLGPFVRLQAQERLAALSPADQQTALLFTGGTASGLSDAELRSFLSRLAMGEELPIATRL